MYNTEISPLKTNVMRLKTPKPIRLIALAGIALFIDSSVSIPSVSVKDWTEVDETGNPLYPLPK